jgi:MoaA/NifB/PqqE/SkfB family radical SAM enzyme
MLLSARDYGFDHFSFTGGEPTMHPEFTEIIETVYKAGYTFGFVSNGSNFTGIYKRILPFRDRLSGITFSLDGAIEETHDRLRAKGSYRRIMSAVSVCVAMDIPFTFNSLMTTNNHVEIREIADIAYKLRSRGLRFGHLIPTPKMNRMKLDISPERRKMIDYTILQLDNSRMPIVIAPGYYTKILFPCAPLTRQEMNIDCLGQITMCCHLSGYGNRAGTGDVIADLHHTDFHKAYSEYNSFIDRFHQDKIKHFSSDHIMDTDYFPCWYCLNYFKKVDWISEFPDNPWNEGVWKKSIDEKETNNERVAASHNT